MRENILNLIVTPVHCDALASIDYAPIVNNERTVCMLVRLFFRASTACFVRTEGGGGRGSSAMRIPMYHCHSDVIIVSHGERTSG